MNHNITIRLGIAGLLAMALLLPSATVKSDPVYFAGTPPTISQVPLYLKDSVPPLNMLVMGKDHKIYYEAYNDASDLNGDGALDIGYKPATIDYYGYYNSNVCYTYEAANGGRFVPSSAASSKQCSSKWSGDFLNYLTTSRMDALRRVLYGGWRQVDTATDTTLQGAFFPQDAHSWGKEYASTTVSGYDISKYAPLGQPNTGKYHLFAVTTVSDGTAPLFRVMQNSPFRVWNWLSIEGPVAGNSCFNSSNQRTGCLGGSTAFPGHPNNRSEYDTLVTNFAKPANSYGTDANTVIDCSNGACNTKGIDDEYLTIIKGQFTIANNRSGNYEFAIDGDDAVDFELRTGSATGTVVNNSRIGCYGGRGMAGGNGCASTGNISLSAGTTYYINFRHEDATGGDGYRLQWRKTSGSNQFAYAVMDISASNGGNLTSTSGKNFGFEFFDLTPYTPNGATRTDYNVRVRVCPDDTNLQDGTCKKYGSHYKPTGILHDYGEGQKMYFGLITGSQFNNLEGGVLRKNISNFADEISAGDGTFKSGTGIANALSKLRMIGGGYDSGDANNLNGDSNWNWSHGYGNCNANSIGGDPITNGQCRMWGNPIAEMMFEGMRYFAGAKVATARFGSGGATEGHNEEDAMGLSQEAWKDPYASDGGAYPTCAKPYETVISDINPSYDSDLPGSAFASISADTSVPGFSASGEGQTIWNKEFGGPRNVFIGDVNGTTDGAPTAKVATSFGNIRGLAPEEPTKGGSYYAASVARYGYVTDLNVASDLQKLGVYSIALASPLPRIEFPVGGKTVTLLPFAKTASGTFGGGILKPTNTIVDFYVEKIVNLPNQPVDTTAAGNDGRPYAVFRINYEDVEQGNDHDMDAIVKYTIKANANGTLTVLLDSEYAAGSADQNIGYVLSGTTQDGIYLDVRDSDSTAATFTRYDLNTPQDKGPGGCKGITTGTCNQQLPLQSNRTFTPSATAAIATELQNPLWYAAKYGGFKDANDNDLPDTGEWDSNKAGQPDNYFLVTNPLQLRTQLTKAFDSISDRDLDVGVATISGARVGNSSFTLQPTFNRARNSKDWTGNLTAIAVNTNGTLGDTLWNAQAKLKLQSPASRNIRTFKSNAGVAFDSTNISLADLGIASGTVATIYGTAYTNTNFVDYLRGDQTNEGDTKGSGKTLRVRGAVLGDIVNSEPIVVSPRANYGYGYYSATMFSGYTGTGGYLETKSTRKTVAYVGANDGMFHAFDASTQPCSDPTKTCAKAAAGNELFAFIPGGVLDRLGKLALPDTPYLDSTASFQHQYYADGQITVSDAKNGSNWKTLMIGSAGAGGRSVFALDVSNPDSVGNASVLWERNGKTDLDVGNVYGKPLLVPLENNQWGVLFGNGYGGNRSDPSLYILDAFSGAVIKKITANDGDQAETSFLAGLICSLTDFLLPNFPGCAKANAPFNGLGQVTAIDKNGNGKVDTVYGGDLQGNLWKFDLSAANQSGWGVANSGAALFNAKIGTEAQPITGAIRVAAGPGTGVMVYFGTGRYFVTGDNDVPATPQTQSLYAVFDNFTSAAGDRSNLVAQSITAETVVTVDDKGTSDTADDITYTSRNLSRTPVSYYGPNAKRGWYLDLKVATSANGGGERFIATPLIQSGRVFFATYRPSKNSCDPGGINFQYGLDLLSGAGTLADVKVLPTGKAACTDGACGGVAINNSGGAPVMGTGIAAINELTAANPTCEADPTLPGCAGGPTFEQCQVVIYPGGFVLPRPCGRQSWRQVK